MGSLTRRPLFEKCERSRDGSDWTSNKCRVCEGQQSTEISTPPVRCYAEKGGSQYTSIRWPSGSRHLNAT
jgi:hypothetical protein